MSTETDMRNGNVLYKDPQGNFINEQQLNTIYGEQLVNHDSGIDTFAKDKLIGILGSPDVVIAQGRIRKFLPIQDLSPDDDTANTYVRMGSNNSIPFTKPNSIVAYDNWCFWNQLGAEVQYDSVYQEDISSTMQLSLGDDEVSYKEFYNVRTEAGYLQFRLSYAPTDSIHSTVVGFKEGKVNEEEFRNMLLARLSDEKVSLTKLPNEYNKEPILLGLPDYIE